MKTPEEIYAMLLSDGKATLKYLEDEYEGQNRVVRLASIYAVHRTNLMWRLQFPIALPAYKVKNLFLKFSYTGLTEVCEVKGWRIPTIQELRDSPMDIEHDWVWVSDEPTHDNEDGTRKVLYNRKEDLTKQVHRDWLQHCCVIKER